MNGFVLINKPFGATSFKVTGAVKRKTGEKRCGHAGTLDPIATGVLPVMIGRATRLIDLIDDNKKAYKAEIVFGLTTDTLDCEGEVLTDQPVNVTEEQIRSALKDFEGEITQIPPMYSALSKDGVKLYKLARKGVEVERKPRKVTVFSIKLLSFDGVDTAEIEVVCSKGTYIRTIIDDLGMKLKCGAFMSKLKRTYGSGFSLDECISLQDFLESDIKDTVIPADKAVMSFPAIFVTQKQAVRFQNGNELDLKRLRIIEKASYYRVYLGKKFLGLGEIKNDSLKPKCVF
ncbi:MAG: tRNA pseudouridine(55) synthase TruB [Clostridia bacterium]|nr:tRNA pseudouridine(55) synthase TruB [Clostridia bacterium]